MFDREAYMRERRGEDRRMMALLAAERAVMRAVREHPLVRLHATGYLATEPLVVAVAEVRRVDATTWEDFDEG